MPPLLTTASGSNSELNTDKAITLLQSKLTAQDEAHSHHSNGGQTTALFGRIRQPFHMESCIPMQRLQASLSFSISCTQKPATDQTPCTELKLTSNVQTTGSEKKYSD